MSEKSQKVIKVTDREARTKLAKLLKQQIKEVAVRKGLFITELSINLAICLCKILPAYQPIIVVKLGSHC